MIARRILALAVLWPAMLAPGTGPAQEAQLVLPPDADEDLRTTLRAASLTLSLETEGLTEPSDYVAAARADYRRLLTGLYAEGYYGGTISITVDGREAAAIQPLDAPAAIGRVVLAVTPGPRFTFGQTAIGPLAPATILPEGFAPGGVAGSETIRDAVRAAVAAWRDEGNALAAVAQQDVVAVQPEARLDVQVAIDPGPELTFGPVTVSGNEDVRASAIRRIAEISEGTQFSPAVLELAATRLRRTGAFDSVAIVEADEAAGGALPIALQVDESLPRRVGFGAELSSLDGLSANAFWLHRNIGGGAERLRFEAEVANIGSEQVGNNSGGIDYELGVTFARPATLDADNDLTLEARLEREDAEDYLLDQLAFDVGLTRYASETLTVEGAVGLLVAREDTAIEDREYALLTLPLAATWDRRDDERDARAGFYLGAEATPFLSLAGDSGSGARIYADGRIYRTFGERVTLAARGQAGSVVGPDRADAPQDFLFFSGGGGTVRGQPFESLGVEIPDPDEPGETATLGAASFLGAQLEARVGVTDSIAAVAFYDVGLTDADAVPTEDAESHAGTGLGIRYDTAIGPIRLDVATPASGDDAFRRVRLYIGIGQSF